MMRLVEPSYLCSNPPSPEECYALVCHCKMGINVGKTGKSLNYGVMRDHDFMCVTPISLTLVFL